MARGDAEAASSGDPPAKGPGLILHAVFSALILALALGLAAVGVYNVVKVNGPVLPLTYDGPSFFASAVRLGILGMVLGVGLALLYVAVAVVLSSRRIPVVFAILFVTLQFIAFVLALFLAVSSLLVAAVPLRSAVDAYFSDAWTQTVAASPGDVCGIEAALGCRGYANDQCVECSPDEAVAGACTITDARFCAPCVGGSEAQGRGCRREVEVLVRRWFEPMGILAAVLAGLLFIHMFLLCFV
ncbi:hypothetical protein BU14_0254s0038 [Porphyra umbilicalis]|uniref:Uncharacterized protein n=1 Tax=Porphyra umbilicalis TaxID=2786 RepID=A0A1X6P2U2_PORUM|nr:hypothetical protein BU14_0254s0038 [Porphyra umbilicalis]|eukprot:OSX75158.1 hypothetical protein BU14_0254s0038 [Porphyra umbilicalis]